MLYTYDINRLKFNRVSLIQYVLYLAIPLILISALSFLYGYTVRLELNLKNMSDVEKILLIEDIDPFSEDAMIDVLLGLGVKFPYIPYAQSKLETGDWKSNLFIENHNLFGMKAATRRVSTAKGSNKGHAYYDNWRESIYDYAFYQSRYLGTIKTEADYFQYLSASYAEDVEYVSKLKKLIDDGGIREKFK